MISIKNIFLVIVISLNLLSFKAQSHTIKFKNLTIKEGLSQSTVNCIIQDEQGYMWAGTQDGLNKFDGYNVEVYKHKLDDSASLSNSFITSLYVDNYGTLWVGTQDGGINYKINKQFKRLYLSETLNTSTINVIKGDSIGNIWFGTNKFGLIKYNPKTKAIKRYNMSNGLISNEINDLLVCNNNLILVATSKGLVKLNCFTNEILGTGFINKHLNEPSINCLSKINDSTILIGTNTGVNILKHIAVKTGATYCSNITKLNERYILIDNLSEELNKYVISNIYGTDINNLWFCTTGNGLINYKIENSDEITHNNFNSTEINRENKKYNIHLYQNSNYVSNSLLSDMTLSIYKDKTGCIWVGTQNGLSFFDPVKQFFTSYNSEDDINNSLIDKNIWSISDINDSIIIVGTRKGISKINNNTGDYYNYPYKSENPNLPENHDIWDVVVDKDNNIWVASNGGLYLLESYNNNNNNNNNARYKKIYIDDKELNNNVVYDIDIDQNNNILLACSEGFVIINPIDYSCDIIKHNDTIKNTIPYAEGRKVYPSKNGDIWLGFVGKGLTKVSLDTIDDKVNFLFTNYSTSNSELSHNSVLSIWEDDDDNLWLGTYGGGLNKLDLKTNKFSHFTENEGLSNNSIYGVIGGDSNELWLSTNFGLNVFNTKTETFKVLTEKDGLQNNEFNVNSYYKSASGRLFFGGMSGFNSFYSSEIKVNQTPPIVSINNVQISSENEYIEIPEYKNRLQIDTLRLDYKQNNLLFNYVGLHYSHSESNIYKINLEGLYDEPLFVNDLRQITYSNLDPGKYTFKVWAANSDGIWSEPKELVLYISSPFWMHWAFITIASVVLLLLIFGGYILRINVMKRQKRRLAFLVERRTKTITKQKEYIEKQTKILKREKDKADKLLSNILPEEIAEELKNKGKARPRQYRMASVLFTDIKNFSLIAEKMDAADMVKSLDNLFRKFDQIIEKHQLEKIKTIGDAYMAAGGVPLRDKENPINCILAALDIQKHMLKEKEKAILNSENYWEVRVGIHTGDIIAGVIGSKRIAYDIWGSNVNIAQRIESEGMPWKVNISEATYEYVVPFFEFTNRGEIPTKNTGKISMYFVDRIKPYLSKDKEGVVPNDKFIDYVNLHIYSSINYKKAERHIMKILKAQLSPNLHYHAIHHTNDVVAAAERIAIMEGVLDEDIFVLKSAATYHDAGFVKQYDANEEIGAKMAEEILPKYGYTDDQIKQVRELIYATIVPHKPNNHLEEIICDADLDYLGRDDFFKISETLRLELREHGKINSDRLWDEIQIKFLNQHKYFTKSSQRLRSKKKKEHIEAIKLRLKRNEYKD